MDGIRMETGECELEFTNEEARAMKTAIVYTLFEMMVHNKGDHNVKKTLSEINHALDELGVKVNG